MFNLIWMSFFASLAFIYPVYTLFLLSRDMNLTNVLTLESVLALGIILWEVPSSLMADRWGRKKMIVLSRGLELLGAVPMLWARGFAAFAGLYFLSGLAIASQSGALEAYIYETMGERGDMTRRLGIIHAVQSAGMLLGSLAGGLIMARLGEAGYVVCLGLAIGSASLSLAAALRLKTDVPTAAQEHTSLKEILRTGTRAVFSSSAVLVLALLMFNLPGSVEQHYLWQPYMQQLGLGIGWFGPAAMGVSIAGILGSLLASWLSRRKISARRVVLLGGGMCLALLAVVITTRHIGWGLAGLLGLFLMNALLDPILITQLNRHFPDQARATALSGVSWVSSTTRMLIRPGIGYLADLNITYPFRWDLLAMGASLLVAALMKGTLNKEEAGMQAPEQEQSLYRPAADQPVFLPEAGCPESELGASGWAPGSTARPMR
jgi:MFS family permease